MMALPRVGLRKLLKVVGVSLVAFIIIHQLNYKDDYTLASQISESIEVIKSCPRSAPTQSNDPRLEIPDLIHQIWKTANVDTYSIEASHESWKTTFEPMNYTVKLWTEDDIIGLVKAKYPWLLSTYEGYQQNIQRADIARLMVVHAEGGIYADLDVHPRSVEGISCLQNLGLQGIFASTVGTLGLSNHFFMARRGSVLLEWILYEAKRRAGPRSKIIPLPYLRVFWSTGPMMVTSAFRKYAWMYSTMDYGLGLLDKSYGSSLTWHEAGRSWHGWDGRLLNYIADHIRVESLWLALSFSVAFFGLACIMIRRRYDLKSRLYKATFLSGRTGL
ncbi:hypothetical protein PISL3812_09160 [Talaromyces islandicus]|uniref:Mannosyl phosphorylinositol ceramide synthase SUR1 n=1 Tax=Talaromyces islandicus TaxID=28573 RepID=A0A0U1M960_TALIS|nr:hypothetical protein PISL3812_09160 [Talaromyces islandicus]